MTLSLNIDLDAILNKAQSEEHDLMRLAQGEHFLSPYYSQPHAGRYSTKPVPKYSIPDEGTTEAAAYELLKSELLLDGKPALNLASFVQTWMPENAQRLMSETLGINLCDQDEYPATMAIHARCISIISNLWKAPKHELADDRSKAALGTATTGSSEAIMLGLLAAKRRWQEKQKAEGKDVHKPGPNIVFGSNVHVAVEKFARYWEVEERPVDIDESTNYCLSPKRAMEKVDENTIAVLVIMGSTYTGHYEPVEEMAQLLDEYQEKTGIDVPIHVDAASGGFVAPFATPDFKWSFEIPRVASINASGHKFGMVFPGLGWIIFRSANLVPRDLVFELHYLGSVEYSFGLNFSRPAAPVLGQMYNFINLGRSGYTAAMNDNLQNARLLSRALELSGLFLVVSDIHRPISDEAEKALSKSKAQHTDASNFKPGLPAVAFRWTDEFSRENPKLQQRWLQVLLRIKGWIVPNYELSPSLQHVQIMRVVVRDTMTESMVAALLGDIIAMTKQLATDSHAIPSHLAALKEGSARHDPSQKRHGDAAHGRPHGHGDRPRGFNGQC
ncbi:glutamate decarboxylase [Malassezia vespertilionis]|uniref:Glutamate decarboxylase n=1 Tax=Malassezia vespertilionis TaxID=2020962 RepID=A0A2N1J7E7_9BASI|nr:glutamate decarboxylase [Malassezia vespertilionis]PKI82485.1 hypothetical protein MVES_003683 [Malassezia vespertilionis]WFD08076.1 glutamate decarboxylase [Malassezia vespertilionis]